MAAQPWRPGDRAAPGPRRAPGHLGRLGRRHRRGAGAVRPRRHPPAPGAAQRRGAGALLRGPVQRDDLAALPRRGGDAAVPAALAGGLPHGQRPVRRGRGGGRGPRAPPSGCRTTSSSSSRRCCASGGPTCKIGFFLHIPFPPIELFMQMPFRAEILRGLLGADLVGFQQRLAAQNFVRLARHLLGLRYEGQTIDMDGRPVKAGAFPISIDVAEMERMAGDPSVQARAKQIRAELGRPEDDHPRRRPARLHQGHRAAPQGVPRAAFRREVDSARSGDGAGRHAEP